MARAILDWLRKCLTCKHFKKDKCVEAIDLENDVNSFELIDYHDLTNYNLEEQRFIKLSVEVPVNSVKILNSYFKQCKKLKAEIGERFCRNFEDYIKWMLEYDCSRHMVRNAKRILETVQIDNLLVKSRVQECSDILATSEKFTKGIDMLCKYYKGIRCKLKGFNEDSFNIDVEKMILKAAIEYTNQNDIELLCFNDIVSLFGKNDFLQFVYDNTFLSSYCKKEDLVKRAVDVITDLIKRLLHLI